MVAACVKRVAKDEVAPAWFTNSVLCQEYRGGSVPRLRARTESAPLTTPESLSSLHVSDGVASTRTCAALRHGQARDTMEYHVTLRRERGASRWGLSYPSLDNTCWSARGPACSTVHQVHRPPRRSFLLPFSNGINLQNRIKPACRRYISTPALPWPCWMIATSLAPAPLAEAIPIQLRPMPANEPQELASCGRSQDMSRRNTVIHFLAPALLSPFMRSGNVHPCCEATVLV